MDTCKALVAIRFRNKQEAATPLFPGQDLVGLAPLTAAGKGILYSNTFELINYIVHTHSLRLETTRVEHGGAFYG